MEIFRTFPDAQSARAYRHEHGTGGWIFEPDTAGAPCILFPPEYSPSMIFRHPFTVGKSGILIGSM